MDRGSRIAKMDIYISGRRLMRSSTKVRIIPASPIPKRAVEITRDPKFDQLPTEKILIT